MVVNHVPHGQLMREFFKLITKVVLRGGKESELCVAFSFWYFVCVLNIQVSFSAEIKVV